VFARGFKTWCEQVALQQRRNLGLSPTDPLDPHGLAAHLNVQVWKAEDIPGLESQYLHILLVSDPESWSAATLLLGNRPLIILNSAHSKGRQSSDLMHELSHLIIGHEPGRVDVSENGLLMLTTFNKDQEDEATWLAGCLLLPREALLFIRRKKMSDSEVETKYQVSNQMYQYRLRVSGVDSQLSRAKQKYRSSASKKSL
jgi:hypothetical protein